MLRYTQVKGGMMPDEICHHGICYVKNPGDKYKYKLTEDYSHSTGITGGDGGNVYLKIDLASQAHS